MADTDFGTLNATRKIVFDRIIWQDGRDMSFWHANGFMGRGTGDMSKPIHYVNSLTVHGQGRQVRHAACPGPRERRRGR